MKKTKNQLLNEIISLKAALRTAQKANAKLEVKQLVAKARQDAREEIGIAFCLPQPR